MACVFCRGKTSITRRGMKITLPTTWIPGRKLKCDGNKPLCSNCDRRGLACSYSPVYAYSTNNVLKVSNPARIVAPLTRRNKIPASPYISVVITCTDPESHTRGPSWDYWLIFLFHVVEPIRVLPCHFLAPFGRRRAAGAQSFADGFTAFIGLSCSSQSDKAKSKLHHFWMAASLPCIRLPCGSSV